MLSVAEDLERDAELDQLGTELRESTRELLNLMPNLPKETSGILENVRENEGAFRAMLESLRDIEIVGDVRGAGYFQAVELVKDRDTRQSFDDEESETLLRGFLSGELFKRGLICRADDRGDPVIQLSPPLIAGPEHFEEIESVLRPVLEEASRRMLHGAG